MDHAPSQLGAPAATFTQLLSATPRGARLARLLAVHELQAWDVSSDLVERAELVVAELAANAVLHGSPPDRCFRITLVLDAPNDRIRIELTDTRGDRLPRAGTTADPLTQSGRGLQLVAALTDSWSTVRHDDGSKTVRAVLSAPRAHT